MLTPRQRCLAAFDQGAYPPVWQPRLEHWYNVNKRQGTLPERYRHMELLDVYDDLGASVRPYHIFNPALRCIEDPSIERTVADSPDRVTITWRTPVGEVSAVERRTELAQQRAEFPIKRIEDIKVIDYMLRGRRWEFDREVYEKGVAIVGDRAEPTIYIQRVNLQRLFLEYMGFENTLYALNDHPREMERLIRTIDETDEAMLEIVANCPIRVINFGDNVHSHLLGARLFERWLLPVYRRRAELLHRAGKYVYAHWDGYVRELLPSVHYTGLDGIEAITPQPQGDVTLEEVKAALGDDFTLVDGIPAVYFLPGYPVEDLVACTRKVLDLFSPRLILGISDEISPPGDIERVRLVSETVRAWWEGQSGR